jgi:Flp pilus assembly protein CpaB
MKRNMVPLLGIAFVVAIISTGVFYGLFAGKLRSSNELPGHAIVVAARDLDRGTVIQPSDLRVSEVPGVLGGAFSKPEEATGATLLTALKANEPLLEERVSARVSEGAAAGGIVPNGMRAITMHVFQSESLLSMLRPGSRVDVQAVSDKSGSTELRTVLENVQVLAVSAADANGNRPAGAAVTVLIRAQDTDMVALADAGSRIRVALRNPMDEATTPRHSLTLSALFALNNTREPDAPESTRSANAPGWEHPIQLRVRVLDASDEALEALRAQCHEITTDHSWRIAAFQAGEESWKLIQTLEQKQKLAIVSSERLMAGMARPISYHAGAKPDQLRVRFSSESRGLRVKLRLGGAKGPEAQLPDTSNFLLESHANDPAGKLFPGYVWKNKHLVIFVSAHALQPAASGAVARTERGR